MNHLRVSVPARIAVVAIALCVWLSLGMGVFAAVAHQPALKLGEESTSDDEAKVIDDLVKQQQEDMKLTGLNKRGQHIKAHGCVDAKFTVLHDIPNEHRLGIFKEAKSYNAKVRFSNGTKADDRESDSHGMAIKVFGLVGKGPRAVEDRKEEQDFVLADGEEFLAPDQHAMLAFMRARNEAAKKKDPKVMVQFLKDNPVVKRALKGFVKDPPPSPLVPKYFSSVPYKLGSKAVKYTALPADGNGPGDIKRESKDYLRAALINRLAKGSKAAVFTLCIVPQTDPKKTPIEDPTIHWDATPIPVASITIEPQVFDTEAGNKECEKLAFDPWNSLVEHRPLGGINRARKAVYEISVNARR